MDNVIIVMQVFGGSWGSTLALAYSQAHPNKVRKFISLTIISFVENGNMPYVIKKFLPFIYKF